VDQDRRAAPRHYVPDDVDAEISGVSVRLMDLSLVGAKAEHEERFTLASAQLILKWHGYVATAAIRIARSEIVGRRGEKLVYRTGLYFVGLDSATQGFIASLLREPQPTGSASLDATASVSTSLDDTWTRQVRLLRNELDEDLPFAQFRLTATGWLKEYVVSAAQPEDGFTILREQQDFHELQRTFEVADAETRRMMQVALESQSLKGATFRSG